MRIPKSIPREILEKLVNEYVSDATISVSEIHRRYGIKHAEITRELISRGVFRNTWGPGSYRGQYMKAALSKPKTGRFANDPYFNQEKKK